jgi:hypothetical protein
MIDDRLLQVMTSEASDYGSIVLVPPKGKIILNNNNYITKVYVLIKSIFSAGIAVALVLNDR